MVQVKFVNPFRRISLTTADMDEVQVVAKTIVEANLSPYLQYWDVDKRKVNPNSWKLIKSRDQMRVYSELKEPTCEDPFKSVAVKWMELAVRRRSMGLLKNRDYVYVEATGVQDLPSGERLGYHIMHSVDIPQAHDLAGRVRAKLSVCSFFRQRKDDTVSVYVMAMMDPMSDKFSMAKGEYVASPLRRITLAPGDVSELQVVADAILDANLERYQHFTDVDNCKIESKAWKYIKTKDQIKVGSAVLSIAKAPTSEEPFQSVVVNWMELDVRRRSMGIVKNRDYIYVEATGMKLMANDTESTVSVYMMGMMDPMSDGVRRMIVPCFVKRMLAPLKYACYGEMKKLTQALGARSTWDGWESSWGITWKPHRSCLTSKREVNSGHLLDSKPLAVPESATGYETSQHQTQTYSSSHSVLYRLARFLGDTNNLLNIVNTIVHTSLERVTVSSYRWNTSGSLDDVMLGVVNPTLESMRIKASYVNDLSAAAVLSNVVNPTPTDPFNSVVVKWMELDIPFQATGLVQNRDYVSSQSIRALRPDEEAHVGFGLCVFPVKSGGNSRPGTDLCDLQEVGV
eukprot:jgi/Phyca11/20855/fgenesh1_pg.PHYCAscaffold_74_\